MEINHDKIDEAVLALMWLTLHNGCRAWKSFDWDVTDRLYQKGFICDPANKAMTGDNPKNLTLDLSCHQVFAAGRRPVAIRGPFPELEEEIAKDHKDFW